MNAPNPNSKPNRQPNAFQRASNMAMAACLAVMSLAVFVNAVLRYGFGGGIAASEEISRLLFVWMVFIGATAAYPQGEHMAFTSLLSTLRKRPKVFMLAVQLVRLLVIAGAGLVAWGAWQQVVVGMGSKSVVLGYPQALLPLPALLCSASIAVMAAWQLVRHAPMSLDHEAEVE
jgi:TRAP-type transport system small permease protein